jgi:hypothetical protein
VLGLLAGAPPRVTLKPQAEGGYFLSWNVPDAPGGLDQWAQYVQETVKHYQPWISHWEIWNEPYGNGVRDAFFPGTPEQYAEVLKRASTTIRETNPEATILGVCAPESNSGWLDRVLKVAGPKSYDVMSFHLYGTNPKVARVVAELTAAQAGHGAPKPMWNTEGNQTEIGSWYVQKTSDMHFQISTIIRNDVAQLAEGVRKFFTYSMGTSGFQGCADLSLLEYDNVPKPLDVARAVLASLIDGAAYAGRTEPEPGVEAYSFNQTDKKIVQALWSTDQKSHALAIPAGWKALDALGNPIEGKTAQAGVEPIYFVQNK